jgi:uncharacterized protein
MFRNNKSPVFQSFFYVLVTYIFSWAFFIPMMLQSNYKIFPDNGFWYILAGSFGPTIGAIVSYLVFNGSNETKNWLRKCFNFKFGWRAFLMLALVFPFVNFVLYSLFKPYGLEWWKVFITMVPAMLINGVVGLISGAGPLGEELGWRGFLSPTLLKKFNIYYTSIFIGIIWSFWHLPLLFIAEFRANLDFGTYLLMYTIGTTAMSYAFIKLAEVSKGSIVAAIIFHNVINTTSSTLFASTFFNFNKEQPAVFDIALFSPISMIITAIIFGIIVNTKLIKTPPTPADIAQIYKF